MNDLDEKLDEITGRRRGNDDGDDELDYTGGDANDVLYNHNEEDLSGISDAAMNVGKSAASFLAGVGETVGGAAASIRMHQSTGRPPFVMAAVEDDDDEYVEGGEQQQEEEEEEEEAQLGWSDSEEEEEEEEGSSSGDDEVDFTNERQSLTLESFDVVKMRQGLSHVEKERNHCLQMVEDRNQEICKLKLFVDQFSLRDSTSSSQDLETLKRDVLWFKTLLQGEDPNQLKSILSEMRMELNRSRVRITNEETTIVGLEMRIQSTKESLANSQATINQTLLVKEKVKQTALKKKLEALKVRLCALQVEIETSRGNIADLQLQNEELLEKLVDDRQVAVKVRSEQNSPSSSTSSGVLVGRND